MNIKFHVLSTSGLHPPKRKNFNSKLHHLNNASFVILLAYYGLSQRTCWNINYNINCNFTKVKTYLKLMRYITYLLTPWSRVLLEKLTGLQLVKKFPAFHGTRRFITALTSVRQISLSCASPIQSIYPHPTSWRSIIILSTHLRLGPHSGLFPSSFPTKNLYTPSPHPYAPHAQPSGLFCLQNKHPACECFLT